MRPQDSKLLGRSQEALVLKEIPISSIWEAATLYLEAWQFLCISFHQGTLENAISASKGEEDSYLLLQLPCTMQPLPTLRCSPFFPPQRRAWGHLQLLVGICNGPWEPLSSSGVRLEPHHHQAYIYIYRYCFIIFVCKLGSESLRNM